VRGFNGPRLRAYPKTGRHSERSEESSLYYRDPSLRSG
jgi:hypothetical protein